MCHLNHDRGPQAITRTFVFICLFLITGAALELLDLGKILLELNSLECFSTAVRLLLGKYKKKKGF